MKIRYAGIALVFVVGGAITTTVALATPGSGSVATPLRRGTLGANVKMWTADIVGGGLTWRGVFLAAAFGGTSGAGSSSESSREANTKIAFSCNGGICLINADGSGRQRLRRDKFIDSYPAWSPDGRRIAFTGNLGRTVIYVMNADGSGRRRLTPIHGDDALPAWSPDGRTIAFDNNTTGEINLMNADGSRRRPLARRTASLPAWSPDGKQIAFVSAHGRRLSLTSGDIYVTKTDGTGQRRLARNGTFPAWSPDGTKIAFLRNKRRWSKDVAVWVMNADGGGQRRLWTHSAEGGGLSWSPDGTSIVLTSDGDIYVMNADGSRSRQLTRGWGDNLDPAWQPTSGASRAGAAFRE